MISDADPKDFRWEIGCAICGPETRCAGEPLLLSRGITVWLCQEHRSTAYLTKQGGIAFVDAMTAAWNASCGLSIRRQEALSAHIRWVRAVRDRERLPSFVEPWIGSRPSPARRKRTARRGRGLVVKPPFLMPIPLPRSPTTSEPAPPRDAAQVRPPKPPRRPGGPPPQARPDDQPP